MAIIPEDELKPSKTSIDILEDYCTKHQISTPRFTLHTRCDVEGKNQGVQYTARFKGDMYLSTGVFKTPKEAKIHICQSILTKACGVSQGPIELQLNVEEKSAIDALERICKEKGFGMPVFKLNKVPRDDGKTMGVKYIATFRDVEYNLEEVWKTPKEAKAHICWHILKEACGVDGEALERIKPKESNRVREAIQ